MPGDGGILASAHFRPEVFVELFQRMVFNDYHGARALWSDIEPKVRTLLEQPNPMPLKHCLWHQRAIKSPECKFPTRGVSSSLAAEIEALNSHMT